MSGRRLRTLLIEIAILIGVTLAVALMGPFGTYALGGLAQRLGYWALMIFGGYGIVRPAMAAAPILAERLAFPEAAVWTALVLLAAVPMTLLVFAVGGARAAPSAEAFVGLYPNVALLGGIVSVLFWLRRDRLPAGTAVEAVPSPAQAAVALGGAGVPPVSVAAGPDSASEVPLLSRLPAYRQGALRALEMEDHYVRVHTSAGSHLLLLRLRDAVAETGDIEGEQVHRSWWVARAAVEGQAGDARSMRLKLAGGLEAPVARSSIRRLKALGWIA